MSIKKLDSHHSHPIATAFWVVSLLAIAITIFVNILIAY